MDNRAKYLRRLVLQAMQKAGRGHLGPALSLIEICRALYDHVMIHDASTPDDGARDRFILSKGHGCLAQYVLLADHGYFPKEELDRFCQYDGLLGGHPEKGRVPGIEASTGALGHGLPIAVGMARVLRLKQQASRVFVVMGDGEMNEGSVWEAALSAGHHKLANLVVLVDYNRMQSYGPVEDVLDPEPLADKWKAFGFDVQSVDGHNVASIVAACDAAGDAPCLVICHTVKGKGLPGAENDPAWHHKNTIDDDVMVTLETALADSADGGPIHAVPLQEMANA